MTRVISASATTWGYVEDSLRHEAGNAMGDESTHLWTLADKIATVQRRPQQRRSKPLSVQVTGPEASAAAYWLPDADVVCEYDAPRGYAGVYNKLHKVAWALAEVTR